MFDDCLAHLDLLHEIKLRNAFVRCWTQKTAVVRGGGLVALSSVESQGETSQEWNK